MHVGGRAATDRNRICGLGTACLEVNASWKRRGNGFNEPDGVERSSDPTKAARSSLLYVSWLAAPLVWLLLHSRMIVSSSLSLSFVTLKNSERALSSTAIDPVSQCLCLFEKGIPHL